MLPYAMVSLEVCACAGLSRPIVAAHASGARPRHRQNFHAASVHVPKPLRTMLAITRQT
jgi:hypothetical protein